MQTLRYTGLISLPATFLLAGLGMLWLTSVEFADGGFFQQVRENEQAWTGAHLLLLASTVFMIPAAITMRAAINKPNAGRLGTFSVFVIAPTSILLAGQYAIDFVVPFMVQVGGDALKVHSMLSSSALTNTLFYGLPNLVFLAFLILSVALVWSGAFSRRTGSVLMVNWLVVLLGNLVHPVLQRVAIVLLAVSFMPLLFSLCRSEQDQGSLQVRN